MLGQESLGLFAETVPMSVTTVLSTSEGVEDEGKWFHLTDRELWRASCNVSSPGGLSILLHLHRYYTIACEQNLTHCPVSQSFIGTELCYFFNIMSVTAFA